MEEDGANSSVQGPVADQNPNSVEGTIQSGFDFGATESTCNNTNNNGGNNNAEGSAVTSDDMLEKTLEHADELMVRGAKAAKEQDYAEATDCYSRALEIKAAHFGELSPECVSAYYKYGCTLLYKAQDEADPLGAMPKKEDASVEDSSTKIAADGESSAASVPENAEQGGSTNGSDEAPAVEENDEGEKVSDDEDLAEGAEGDEDESDLDLAWKMLDVARAIVEKHSGDTIEKVDILSALAEVALEREDVETSLSDYLKSLSILERLVEPDSRLIAELNFRICLCLEIGSKPEEAIPYCEKAISVCKSRVERLKNEVKNLSGPEETPTTSDSSLTAQPAASSTSQSGHSPADKVAEIETLSGLCGELEKKLEDLQQLVANPTSIISDILGIMSAKAKATEKAAGSAAMSSSQIGIVSVGENTESPTVSTAHTNGTPAVTHLGVVGRGVKRVVMSSTVESGPSKKPAIDPSSNTGDGSTS